MTEKVFSCYLKKCLMTFLKFKQTKPLTLSIVKHIMKILLKMKTLDEKKKLYLSFFKTMLFLSYFFKTSTKHQLTKAKKIKKTNNSAHEKKKETFKKKTFRPLGPKTSPHPWSRHWLVPYAKLKAFDILFPVKINAKNHIEDTKYFFVYLLGYALFKVKSNSIEIKKKKR